MSRQNGRLLLAMMLAIVLLPVAARAEEVWNASSRFGLGKQQIGISSGYAEGFGFAGSGGGKENADVRMAAVVPYWGIGISDILGEGDWYRGSFLLLAEGQLLVNTNPRSGYGGAFILSGRYQWLSWRRVVPFFQAGAGIGGIDMDLDSQRDGFEFYLQTGIGAHLFVREQLSITLEARYHHISNAQTRRPNSGINSGLFLIGPTFFFD